MTAADVSSAARSWTAALLVAAVLAAACGGERDGDGRVTLRVLHWAGDLELRTEQEIADRFAERHPGVRVLVESVVTSYDEKLLTSIASGSPPDVYLLDSPDIPTFVDRGLALELTPFAPLVGYRPDSIYPEVEGIFRRGGRLYAFPKDFTPMVLYYNRETFRERGVPYPPDSSWTREAFLETARRLTADVDGDGRTDVWALDFPRNLYRWIAWVWSGGSDILAADGSRATGYLDAEATVATFRFLTDLVARWEVAPSPQFVETGDPARLARFYSGRQAMLGSGHWTMRRLDPYVASGDLEVGVAPIPHREGAEPETVLYASGWAIPPNAPHPRRAVQLAAWLASPEAQRIRAESRLAVPSHRGVARRMAERDTTGVERAFLRRIEGARTTWGARVRDFAEIEQISFRIMDAHLLRGTPLEATAREAAREVDRVLGR